MKIEKTEPELPRKIEIRHIVECGGLEEFAAHAAVSFGNQAPTIWWVDGKVFFMFQEESSLFYKRFYRWLIDKKVVNLVYWTELGDYEPMIKVSGFNLPLRKARGNPHVEKIAEKLFNK